MPAYQNSQQRNALICASTQGLGLAIANRLAEEKHNLFLVARNAERLDAVAHEIAETHEIKVYTHACDLSNAGQRSKLIEAVFKQWTAGPDILIHNTGGPPPSGVLETEYTQWTNGFNSLFMSVTQLNAAFVPLMIEQGWGRVITVTSLSVLEPVANIAISNAMRSAITAYSKTLANEVAASGVTVNCAAPGYIQTERLKHLFYFRAEQSNSTPTQVQRTIEQSIPLHRLGKPHEFAHVVAFLASEQASYITGQTLVVDGGLQKSAF